MAKKRAEHHEEHVDESWLIPYADILTLLLALFIVLFASAQVDQRKYDKLRMSFVEAFSGGSSFMQHQTAGVQPQLQDQSTQAITPYQQETAQLNEVKQAIDQYIQTNGLTGQLETVMLGDGLMIRIREAALFPSGSAVLRPEADKLATEIARMLAPLPQRVSISGHTDNVPIATAEFPSNWELSSRRAVNFTRLMLAREPKLEPGRFTATGNGEFRPIAANTTEEGRSHNRRVEVLVTRDVRTESLPGAAVPGR